MNDHTNTDPSPPISGLSSRRELLSRSALGLGLGLAGSAFAIQAHGSESSTGGATANKASLSTFYTNHQPKPLAFNAAKLSGLSKGLIESHWTNNYRGSVRALNQTNARLADALADKEIPAYTYNNLKREHLMRTGSVVLHELYFDNLGGNGEAPTSLRNLLGAFFGDFDQWETEFRRIAAGLGGGSGWVVLGLNRHLRTLENYWMADHMHGAVDTSPLLVLDMYEHSYHMDYGAATARYIDAFFQNINWEAVEARLENTA